MRVMLSGTLQRYADYRREHTVEGDTLEAGLEALVASCPNLRPVLFDETGAPRGTHAVFVNGEQMMRRDLQRPMEPWDEVEIITALAGG